MAPWFGPKSRYDGGIASWQGLVVAVIFLPSFIFLMNFFRPSDYGLPAWSGKALAMGLLVAFLLLVWIKYDREPDAP